jgi:3-methyladenine DNA glycosylase AlkD
MARNPPAARPQASTRSRPTPPRRALPLSERQAAQPQQGAASGARRLPTAALRAEIEALLSSLGNADRAGNEKAYLKSSLDHLGIDTPTMRREARAWLRRHSELDRRSLLPLLRSLWRAEVHELRHFAIEILFVRQALLTAADLDLLDWLLRRSATWAYIDAIAVHVVGPLIVRFPELAERLDGWSTDGDFWLRRSALLALLLELRRGAGDWERFVRYADGMLEEREFFIRKALGWVLREVGKKRPRLVVAYLTPRRERASGLTLREAVKYLPAADRRRLLGR